MWTYDFKREVVRETLTTAMLIIADVRDACPREDAKITVFPLPAMRRSLREALVQIIAAQSMITPVEWRIPEDDLSDLLQQFARSLLRHEAANKADARKEGTTDA